MITNINSKCVSSTQCDIKTTQYTSSYTIQYVKWSIVFPVIPTSAVIMIVVRAFGEAQCHRSRAGDGGGSGLSSGCDMLITGALSAIVHAVSSEQGGFRRGGGSAWNQNVTLSRDHQQHALHVVFLKITLNARLQCRHWVAGIWTLTNFIFLQ